MEVVCGCQTRGNNNVVQFGTRIEPLWREASISPVGIEGIDPVPIWTRTLRTSLLWAARRLRLTIIDIRDCIAEIGTGLTKICVYFKISLKNPFENKYVVCRAQFLLYKRRDPDNNGGNCQRPYPHTNQSNINHYVNTETNCQHIAAGVGSVGASCRFGYRD